MRQRGNASRHVTRHMQLREMVAGFDELETTSSRRRLVELIAQMLRRAGGEERVPLVYLLQGQLCPPYEGVEIGVGEKLLARVLADAYTTRDAVISQRLRRTGDLGLVAASLAPDAPRRRLSVRQA